MKSTRVLPLTILAASFCAVHSAHSTVIFSDSFDYATGAISGQNGGTGFTGAYNSAGNVTSPGLLYTGLATSGNSLTTAGGNGGAFRAIPTVNTDSGTMWVSMLVQSTGTVPDYGGLSFFSGGAPTGGTEELFLAKPSGSTNYGFDVSGAGTGSVQNSVDAPSTTSTSFLLYRLTFTADGDTIDFFANSTPGVLPNTPTLTFAIPEATFATDSFNNIRLQSGNQTFKFDEIRAATTFAEVSPVPEPGSLALFAGSALLLGAKRRRFSKQ